MRRECVAVFLSDLGDPLEPDGFVDAFMGALVFEEVPGASETLQRLRQRGLKLGVVANWDYALPEHLERLGLAALVDTVVTSARAGAAKPDPAIFGARPARARRSADRALHVGDEPCDEEGARAARPRVPAGPALHGVRRPGMSGRLVAWLAFVGVQILFNYATRASGAKPSRDAVYQWSAAGGHTAHLRGLVRDRARDQSRGDDGAAGAATRPRSWARAAGTAALVIVSVIVLELVLEPFLHANREQSLTPTSWQAAHAGAFAASFVVLVLVGPFVEEATFRGLGFSLLVPDGRLLAILATGVLFGLAHGLVDALPVLVALGVGLGYLALETHSLYPGFVLHALFNAVRMTLAVA